MMRLYRGTILTSLGSLLEDMQGIINGELSAQKEEVHILIQEMIRYAQKEEYDRASPKLAYF